MKRGWCLTDSKSNQIKWPEELDRTGGTDGISLNGSHVQNPFLLRREVQNLYSRIFSPTHDNDQPENRGKQSNHDVFRAFMILAIGSVLPYRNGEFEHHPYGYYLTALNHFDDRFLSGGLASIQDLLLIGRFAIYHHIGKILSVLRWIYTF